MKTRVAPCFQYCSSALIRNTRHAHCTVHYGAHNSKTRRQQQSMYLKATPISGHCKRNRSADPEYMSRKIRKFRTDKFDTWKKRNFDSCNLCKRLVPTRLQELHESTFPFVLRIEFIRSKLSIFSAHVSWFMETASIRTTVTPTAEGCSNVRNTTAISNTAGTAAANAKQDWTFHRPKVLEYTVHLISTLTWGQILTLTFWGQNVYLAMRLAERNTIPSELYLYRAWFESY